MLDIKTDRALRSATQLLELLDAVFHAEPQDELDWIEWKSQYDLANHDSLGHIARHVLGMANRDPERARRTAGGCGYILLGIAPQECNGVDPVDSADLEPQVEKFLNEGGPVWQPVWVAYHGQQVLVVIVDAPRQGDPIHTLATQFAKYDAGDIFVRRRGATHKANPGEVRGLTDRALDDENAEQLRVVLGREREPIEVRPIDLSDAAIDRWLEIERSRLLGPLDRELRQRKPDVGHEDSQSAVTFGEAVARIAEQHSAVVNRGLGRVHKPEDRSPERYRSSVEAYLDACYEVLPEVLVDRHVAIEASRIELIAGNPTDRPFRSVEFSLHVPGHDVWAVEGESYVELPTPPRLWGDRWVERFGFSSLPSGFDTPVSRLADFAVPSAPRQSWVEIDNGGSAQLRFSPVDLAPGAEKQLSAFDLIVPTHLAGSEIQASWSARSIHARGVVDGALPIRVMKDPATVTELLDEARDSS